MRQSELLPIWKDCYRDGSAIYLWSELLVRKIEASIDPCFYRSAAYSSYGTLYSLLEQVRWVMLKGIRDVLYIGVGNGFVPSYLRAQGVAVKTVDVNPELQPDILCDVLDLSAVVGERTHEAVLACEVFEHMPFEAFDAAIGQISKVARTNALVTLPVYRRFPFKWGGAITIARREYPFGLWLSVRKRKLPEEHFWEIGLDRATSVSEIRSVLRKHFPLVADSRMRANPYHHVFELSLQEAQSRKSK